MISKVLLYLFQNLLSLLLLTKATSHFLSFKFLMKSRAVARIWLLGGCVAKRKFERASFKNV